MTLHQAAQKAVELKPCPFCGSDAAKITHDHGTYEPGCTHCGTYIGQYSSERSAIAAWNLRPESALQQQPEPVATFRYEVQPDGESTYDVWLSDGMFAIKTPGDYPLYASLSTTQQPSVAAHALNTTPVVDHATQQQEAGSVPAEVIAWRDAYAEYIAASDAYNARLTAIREREAAHHSEFGRDNPQAEWKAIDKAHGKWHALLRPMFDALAAAPSTPENADGGPHG